MFRKNYETRVEPPPLPNELWIIIFDIVIEEAIVRLDQCDYTTFPYVGLSFLASARRYQLYDSYYRLRLVCRRFNTLLGARLWQPFSDSLSLPIPFTTRSLYFDLKQVINSHYLYLRLFAETSTFGRLVCLDVDCDIFPFHFLDGRARRAFPNVKLLILRIESRIKYKPHGPPNGPFWAHLHRAFPLLVTFILLTEYWTVPEELQWKAGDEIVCFEWLEILYFSREVPHSGCHFPRLRHASIWGCSSPELEILLRSPHLESLLIRSSFAAGHRIDVTSCPSLKLLGFDSYLFIRIVPLGLDHPVEHIWLYYSSSIPDLKLFQKVWRMAPKVYRIILELSSSNQQSLWREIYEQPGRKLDSFGTFMIPPVQGDRYLTFERQRATPEVTGGVLRRVLSKMRR